MKSEESGSERGDHGVSCVRIVAPTLTILIVTASHYGCARPSASSDVSAGPLTKAASIDQFSCRAIEFSPDGKLLAAGGASPWTLSREIRLWDAETLTELTKLSALGTQVAAIAPDGRTFVTASWFGDISVWDMTTGELLRSVRGHNDTIGAIALDGSGKWIATGSEDGTARLWDGATLQEIARFDKHSGGVSVVTFTADSKQFVTGGGDGVIRFWDVEAKAEVKAITDAGWAADEIRFSPDGDWLTAHGSRKCSKVEAKLWHLPEASIRAAYEDVVAISFAPDGEVFATSSFFNATVTLVEVTTGRQRASLIGNPESHYTLGQEPAHAFAPDSKTLAVGVNSVKLMDVATGAVRDVLSGLENMISAIAYSPDGTVLAAGNHTGDLVIWDARTAKQIKSVRTDGQRISSLQFSPDGKRLLAGYVFGSEHVGPLGTVQVVDATSGEPRRALKGHLKPVSSVSFSPDGTTLATGSWDRTVRLWEVATGKELSALSGHGTTVYSVAFSPDGQHLATAAESVRILQTDTWEPTHVLEEPTGPVYSVAFSPDGQLLSAGGDDQQVRVWDVASAERKLATRRFGWPVRSIAFAPDGKQLAVAGGTLQRGTVVLCNVETGRKQREIASHSRPVTAVNFSADGLLFATVSTDKTMRIWDVRSGKQVSASQRFERALTSVAFQPGGEMIAVGNLDSATIFKP